MKKILKASVCLILAIAMFTGCTVVNEAEAGNVNGEKILLGEYKYALTLGEMFFNAVDYDDPLAYVCMYDTYLSSYIYGDIVELYSKARIGEEGNVWEQEIEEGVTVGDKLKEVVFNALVDLRIAGSKAAEMGLTLDESDLASIDDAKNGIIERMGSKITMVNALEDINFTEKGLVNLWKQIALANKLADEITDIEAIEDEAIATYYNANYMRVKHILIKVGDDIADLDAAKAVADEIIAKLNAGENFEALMNENTDDVDADGAVNGGETGYVFKEGDFGNPSFEEAAMALEIGEYTAEPVLVEGGAYSGYHIIKRYAIDNSYLENDTNSIKDTIKSSIKNDAYEAEITALYMNAEIDKNDSKIKRIKLQEPISTNVEAITE